MFVELRNLLRRLPGLGRRGLTRQYGAITYRRAAEGPEFLLITSRRTGRWIFPKGDAMSGLSPPECAEQEAYEEAGAEGRVAPEPVGTYHAIKWRDDGPIRIEVEMYPLEVAAELDDWPEKDQRHRRWVSQREACLLLSDPGLIAMVRKFPAENRPSAAPALD